MIVVSNTSPLVGMARIGQLKLFQQLYRELLIPEAVWQEVVVTGAGKPGAKDVREATWIKKQQVDNQGLVQALRQELDRGEAEAIALAFEVKADLLIIDERLGREMARHLGLKHMGIIGVLIEAKHKGLISQIKPNLDALSSAAGFHLSKALYNRVLKDEGEA